MRRSCRMNNVNGSVSVTLSVELTEVYTRATVARLPQTCGLNPSKENHLAAPKSPQEMFQVMRANIMEKTGKPFDTWVELARISGIEKFKALTDYMKGEHGVTHGYAQMIAWGVIDPARLEAGNQDEGMVDELYTGKKAPLRPIYDKLVEKGKSLDKEIDMVICKTYTSLRSKSQFAIFVPKTNSAVDVELALPPDTQQYPRLETIKSSYPKFSHRIRISDPKEIDEEVVLAVKAALDYNRKD